jgi:hypothetical protein
MNLHEQARAVSSREDLVKFLSALSDDFAKRPEAWSNVDLSSFLEAMSGWAADMEGYYINNGEDLSHISPWRVLADVLTAARVYE